MFGGINTYTYVYNNPVNLIDPDGLTPQGAAYGAALFGGTAAVLSVAADVGTAGANIPATPAEIALAAATGAVVGDVVSDFANNVSSAWDSIYQMAKGGNQNKDNEWSRPARLQPDPCAWLRDQYQKAGDSARVAPISGSVIGGIFSIHVCHF